MTLFKQCRLIIEKGRIIVTELSQNFGNDYFAHELCLTSDFKTTTIVIYGTPFKIIE
jgi:hypothetical protein